MKVTSATCKVNRRTVRRFIRDNTVTGTSLEACASNIIAALELSRECCAPVLEQLYRLAREDEVILNDAVLRLTTDDERTTIADAKKKGRKQAMRSRMRTAAKRHGGHRGVEIRRALAMATEG